jgi:DtxR family Mn-dependent transcriptional regulator
MMITPALSTMTEDYLKIIWKAYEWSDHGITTNEIAATLAVSASSVSGNLAKLAREGYLDYKPYGPIRLSERGRLLALQMVRRHRIIETYLVEHHGYRWDEVHDEAEVLEHAVSDRLLELWDWELGSPTEDPHGDPIPRQDGTIERPNGRRLHELEDGEQATVLRVSDHAAALLRYLDTLGIAVGTRLRLDEKRAYAGTVCLTRVSAAGESEQSMDLALVAANAIWVSTG